MRTAILLTVIITLFSFLSCKKDRPALTEQILTAYGWKVQEHKGVFGNRQVIYVRGGSQNTDNFDNEFVVFTSDRRGIYHDNNGLQSTLTWDFANSLNTKIIWTVYFPEPLGITVVTWDNISYQNGKLIFDQYYTQKGNYAQTQNIRVPK